MKTTEQQLEAMMNFYIGQLIKHYKKESERIRNKTGKPCELYPNIDIARPIIASILLKKLYPDITYKDIESNLK